MSKKDCIYKSILCISIGICAIWAATASSSKEQSTTATSVIGLEQNFDEIRPSYTNDLRELIDSSYNMIIDSGYVLSPFMEKLFNLRNSSKDVVRILHIGDSHLQADYWSKTVREHFFSDFGNAGRGLIVPYKLAKTNEPRDYSIQTTLDIFSYKATDRNIKEIPGITGVATAFEGQECSFRIWSKEKFNSLTILHHSDAPMMGIPQEFDPGLYCTIHNTPTSTHIALNQSTDTLFLRGRLSEKYNNPTFYGFILENGQPGIQYNMIGLNGAAFEHFMNNTTLLEGGADELSPDLIIVSLGTNNCFGSGYRSDLFRKVADKFVKQLTEAYPGSSIIMTTPMESCRRSSRRSAYKPNPNVADVADIICDVANNHDVACWDLFNAAGGDGSNEKWHKNKLIRDDRIHFSEQGYVMLGDMMYDALIRYYNNWLSRHAENQKRLTEN